MQKVTFDVPEIDTHEVLGEWLIPRGEALLVSFGAYTVADQDGMAVVKERLAIIEADEASSAVAGMGPKGFQPVPVPLAAPYASGMNILPPPSVSPSCGQRVDRPRSLPPPRDRAHFRRHRLPRFGWRPRPRRADRFLREFIATARRPNCPRCRPTKPNLIHRRPSRRSRWPARRPRRSPSPSRAKAA